MEQRYFPDLDGRLNDLVVVMGYSSSGVCNYTDAVFREAFIRGIQLWDSLAVAKLFDLARVRCVVFDSVGALVEELDYDCLPKNGARPTVRIRSWDGSVQKLKLPMNRLARSRQQRSPDETKCNPGGAA